MYTSLSLVKIKMIKSKFLFWSSIAVFYHFFQLGILKFQGLKPKLPNNLFVKSILKKKQKKRLVSAPRAWYQNVNVKIKKHELGIKTLVFVKVQKPHQPCLQSHQLPRTISRAKSNRPQHTRDSFTLLNVKGPRRQYIYQIKKGP